MELEVGNKEGLATSLFSIGSIYRQQGRLNEATVECRAARELAEELGDIAGLAAAYYKLGCISESRKDCLEAIRLFVESLRYDAMVGDIESMGVTEYQLGLLHMEMGQPGVAAEWLNEARTHFSFNSSVRLESVLRALASLEDVK